MRNNLLRFILRHHFFIVFVIIESFSIYLLVQKNDFQKSSVMNFTRSISGYFFQRAHQAKEYTRLYEINQELIEENAKLRNQLQSSWASRKSNFHLVSDSLYDEAYYYTPARVINNSTNKQYNFITLNKGSIQGIEPDMGVIAPNGVIGVVKAVSPHYATVISLLNRNLKISAKFKKNNYYGSLEWEGKDYQTVNLNQIPHHVKINIGDTIVTSGFSSIFPAGIIIGFVSDYKIKGGNFYTIKVELANDFKNLSYVHVVKNLMRDEQQKLEERAGND